MVTIENGTTTHKEFHWTPQRGMEGSFYTICWRAWSEVAYPAQLSTETKYARVKNQDGSMELVRRCVHVQVRRCPSWCDTSADHANGDGEHAGMACCECGGEYSNSSSGNTGSSGGYIDASGGLSSNASGGSGWGDGSASWDIPESIRGLMERGYTHCSVAQAKSSQKYSL